MSKVALITDLHFGCRNDSDIFRRFLGDFYSKVFFPVIDARGITTVVDLGDTFDRRKYINFNTLNHAREVLFQPLHDRNIETHVIVGNHDIFFRNTNEVNSPQQLLRQYDNLRIYSEITTIRLYGLPVTIIPWINPQNERSVLEYIKNDTTRVAMGHLEVSGFEMDPGMMCTEGYDSNIFKKYDMVMSGHFHHKSTKGNLTYLGNPYELTWADYGDVRGFHIFDTVTQELEFIANPFKMFYKLYYNDETETPTLPDENLEGKYIKVIQAKKTNPVKFDKYFENLYAQNPADIQIIEASQLSMDVEMNEEDMKNAVKDSKAFLGDYIREVGVVPTKEEEARLIEYMNGLYTEALNEC